MIDLHSHILPGLDDGAIDENSALLMAEVAASEGIHTIVATPHVHDFLLSGVVLQEEVACLNQCLCREKIPVQVVAGIEVYSNYLDDNRLPDWTLNQGAYVLIEFPPHELSATGMDAIYRLRQAGYRPIIAHPERNAEVIANPDTLLSQLFPGIYLQVTAASLTGFFGTMVEHCATHLLKNGAVHFLATDAHGGDTGRLPHLLAGLKRAEKVIGSTQALQLVTRNPQTVLLNQPL